MKNIINKFHFSTFYGIMAVLSFLYVLGIIGSCDLGVEGPHWFAQIVLGGLVFLVNMSLSIYCKNRREDREVRIRYRNHMRELARQAWAEANKD